MDGFGSHAFQWTNSKGEAVWVKYHFKTDQGVKCLTAQEAARIAGENPDYCQLDLLQAIERKELPSWTVKVQIIPLADAARCRFNPFDLTKVWSQKDYPLKELGKMVLDRNPENFADVEQAAFNPANFVPGIGPSPDKMLRPRAFPIGRQGSRGPPGEGRRGKEVRRSSTSRTCGIRRSVATSSKGRRFTTGTAFLRATRD